MWVPEVTLARRRFLGGVRQGIRHAGIIRKGVRGEGNCPLPLALALCSHWTPIFPHSLVATRDPSRTFSTTSFALCTSTSSIASCDCRSMAAITTFARSRSQARRSTFSAMKVRLRQGEKTSPTADEHHLARRIRYAFAFFMFGEALARDLLEQLFGKGEGHIVDEGLKLGLFVRAEGQTIRMNGLSTVFQAVGKRRDDSSVCGHAAIFRSQNGETARLHRGRFLQAG